MCSVVERDIRLERILDLKEKLQVRQVMLTTIVVVGNQVKNESKDEDLLRLVVRFFGSLRLSKVNEQGPRKL